MSTQEQTLRQLIQEVSTEKNWEHPTMELAEAAIFFTQTTSACRERALSRAIAMMFADFSYLSDNEWPNTDCSYDGENEPND